jgi:hypothetical protein
MVERRWGGWSVARAGSQDDTDAPDGRYIERFRRCSLRSGGRSGKRSVSRKCCLVSLVNSLFGFYGRYADFYGKSCGCDEATGNDIWKAVRVDKNGQSQKGLLIAGAVIILLSVIFTGIFNLWIVLLTIVSGIYGVIMALRVGGADMPVVISLLNSFSGVAASITGFAVEDPLLVGVGAIVGVSGLILTRIMCKAMNRSLSAVLTGITTVVTSNRSGTPVQQQSSSIDVPKITEKKTGLAQVVKTARKVIIVPVMVWR